MLRFFNIFAAFSGIFPHDFSKTDLKKEKIYKNPIDPDRVIFPIDGTRQRTLEDRCSGREEQEKKDHRLVHQVDHERVPAKERKRRDNILRQPGHCPVPFPARIGKFPDGHADQDKAHPREDRCVIHAPERERVDAKDKESGRAGDGREEPAEYYENKSDYRVPFPEPEKERREHNRDPHRPVSGSGPDRGDLLQ